MRLKFYVSITLIGLLLNNTIAQPYVHVDERFELTSIAFRLTGEDVCVHSVPENYVADIDNYFSKYENHELIRFLKKTISSKPVFEFSILSDLAGDISIQNGVIKDNDFWITNLQSEDYGKVLEEWTKEELKEYLRLLNHFYKDTKFHTFFEQHKDFYRLTEQNMQKLVDQIDTAWFRDFFGTSFEFENIWVVPANGRNNFSLTRKTRDGKILNNCAMGCVYTDSLGNVLFSKGTLMTLIHEICHNYNNPICDKHIKECSELCDSLFEYVGQKLMSNYYSAKSILYEGMNRFCEFSYYKYHPVFSEEEFQRRITWEGCSGFVWLKEMLDYSNVYYLNRDVYATYEDFFPQLIAFLRTTYGEMKDYYLPKFELLKPFVTATYPINGEKVDTTLSKIIICFSRPMQTAAIWVDGIKDDPSILLPTTSEPYWQDEYTYVVPLKGPLKSNTKYGFSVPNNFPADNQYGQSPKPYNLIFETKEQ